MFRKNLKGLLFIGTAAILAACGNGAEEGNDAENGADTTEPTTLVVASTMPPMTDIVEIAAENISEPYTIELMEISDNVQYNEAVQHEEAYASFSQHEPFKIGRAHV